MQVSVKISGRPESAVLIGMIRQGQDEATVLENLKELKFLAYTANAESKWLVTQRMEAPNPKTFIGTGKIMEVKKYVKENRIDLVIFDDELSPTQLRNIEKIINGSVEEVSCKIIDRTNLILDIFASRARTAHAKSQVELAQYQYLLPRLTRMWTHLERQKGGIGLRGPGETELETDRRIIREKISRLKKKIVIIDKQKAIQRKHRAAMIKVALVGYTNVGKSTLMNLLSKSDVFAENKLFATLDTTIRKVVIENLPFLLSDTVGFIRKLPHQLIESFKSTLDELKDSDLLIHVVDISQSNFESQIDIVNETLKEIGAIDKPSIMIFNKIDLYKDEDRRVSLASFQKSWMSRINESCLFISATKKQNITALKSLFYVKVKGLHTQRYPYDNFLY